MPTLFRYASLLILAAGLGAGLALLGGGISQISPTLLLYGAAAIVSGLLWGAVGWALATILETYPGLCSWLRYGQARGRNGRTDGQGIGILTDRGALGIDLIIMGFAVGGLVILSFL